MPLPPGDVYLPPLADLLICALAASDRRVPQGISQELSYAIKIALESPEGIKVLTISTVEHVQTILLLTMSHELQGAATNHAGSLMFLRIGTALRMGQDLVRRSQRSNRVSSDPRLTANAIDQGLHRDLTESGLSRDELLRRRRIWRACVIADKL
jgi:hypothetical protein